MTDDKHDPELLDRILRRARGEEVPIPRRRPPSLAQVAAAFEELERQGLIRRTGEQIEGHDVFTAVVPT